MARFSLLIRLWFVGLSPRHTPRAVPCAAGVLLVAACGLSGCTKPLFPTGEPRTQYDRYDLVRNQYAPQYTMDEFGRRRPNLRARLLPKD